MTTPTLAERNEAMRYADKLKVEVNRLNQHIADTAISTGGKDGD